MPDWLTQHTLIHTHEALWLAAAGALLIGMAKAGLSGCGLVSVLLFADAFGAKGYRIEELGQMDAVLDEALALNEPVVVDIRIDRDEMVFPMIPPNGTFDDMIVRG